MVSDELTPCRQALIVECNSRGHRLYYVAILESALRLQGYKVTIMTTAEALDSVEWQTHMSSSDSALELCAPSTFSPDQISLLADRLDACLTIIPDGDSYLPSLALHGWGAKSKLSILAMRADRQGTSPWPVRALGTVAKRTLIMAVDARRGVRSLALRSPLSRPQPFIRWVDDPVTLDIDSQRTEEIRRMLTQTGGRYWVGVFGAITPRKNLHVILRALEDHPDVGLLVAGRVDPSAHALFKDALEDRIDSGRPFVQMSGTISDADLDSAISAVDCVIAAHSNEGPSGIVAKAAMAGKKMVLAGARSLRRDARRLPGQAWWCSIDSVEISKAIRAARISKSEFRAPSLDTESFVRGLTWQ